LFITLSAASPDPMYKQITDQARDAIASGELAAGDKLPSIRELAEALNTSVITVKRAYLDLENEGCIISRPGLGSFVAAVDPAQLRERKLAEFRRELTRIVRSGAKFAIRPADLIGLIRLIEEDPDGNHPGNP
jgi:GntR family transcriptional regulator